MNRNYKIHIKEATSDSGGRGSYVSPLQPGIRIFKKSQMGPFTEPVSKYKSPKLEFDSYDGKMSTPKKDIKKIENKADKSSNFMKNHPNLFVSDEDGNIINQTPGKGKKFVPIVREWIEITEDTTIDDIIDNQEKKSSNYDRVVNNFKNIIPEEYHKKLIFILDNIKNYVIDRGFNIKVLNYCATGFRGVRTKDSIIICSPETINNLAVFVYVLFHEMKHEIQMSELGLENSYMGDIEDFERFYEIYWEMELDALEYAKDWVKKIGTLLNLPEKYYKLEPLIENYPMMSNSVKSMMTQLHSQVQKLKKEGMTYEDISDLDVVKKHLDKLEDMF